MTDFKYRGRTKRGRLRLFTPQGESLTPYVKDILFTGISSATDLESIKEIDGSQFTHVEITLKVPKNKFRGYL